MNQTAPPLDVQPVGDRMIRIRRQFRAPRALVFDAHTDPLLVPRWMGPPTWTFTDVAINLRPNGSFRHVMEGPEGQSMVMQGTYLEVDRPSRLVATVTFDDDWTGGQTTETTTFDEVGGLTTVTVVVEFASAQARDGALASGMTEGMAEGYRRLDDLLAADIGRRYTRRADRFESLVTGVDPTRWDDPSPCAEWRARDVVGHIVDMHGVMLRPVGRQLSPAPSTDQDPVAAFRAARADIEALLADRGVATSECDTPMGRMTVAAHIDGVVSADLVLHSWDLARAAGLDDTIDPDEVDQMWPMIEHLPDEMRTPDHFGPGVVVFGPEVAVAADASVQDRLLGKIGRDPRWTPTG